MADWRRGPIIGRGSSATVSLASSPLLDELFAVKSTELAHSDLLRNEQRILSSLNCPQIVTYLGFEVTSLQYNLFIEYAPRGSLYDQIRDYGGRLDEPAIRSHTHDILQGLSYLHTHNLVHCDIKPQNILIASDGHAKITDLGCARWTNLTDDAVCYPIRGTPMFMAPEVARGEEQGPAADVWALGCTVLEMATGRQVWPESDPIAALHRIAFSSATPETPSWFSEEGKDFLNKCLVRNPNHRWTAEKLLKHPFLELLSTKPNSNSNWISPNSTLNQNLSEVFSSYDDDDEEEEEAGKCNKRLSSERIRELEMGCNGVPNWTWDENWVTIRSNREETLMHPTAVEDEVLISPGFISSSSTQDMENFILELIDYRFGDNCTGGISNWPNGDEMKQPSPCKNYLIGFEDRNNNSENPIPRIVFIFDEYWHIPRT